MSGTASADALTLLLPPRERLAGAPDPASPLARLLARADSAIGEAGEQPQLLRVFELLPRTLPIAALTRELDCHDASHARWLRADPAHVRADMGAGRLLACGDLDLSIDEAQALAQALKPLFGDDGAPLSIGDPSRWYLMLPRDSQLPEFAAPEQALGDDIFAHLPQGDAGRRWRRLLSEAQIVLHNHPVNAQRQAAGKASVNSLWFWGGGMLPDRVSSAASIVVSDDIVVRALAARAGLRVQPTSAMSDELVAAGAVVDVRSLRRVTDLEQRWVAPALDAQRAGRFAVLRLDFADGAQRRYERRHRWRLWRRPASALG